MNTQNPVLFEQYLNTARSFNAPKNFFNASLGTEYEDIAGLQPLPLQKMLRQMGRPLNKLYSEFEKTKNELYGNVTRKEIKQQLKPNPERNQAIINRAQAVEKVRQTWDPLEAEWKERENKLNPTPRSKPSQASFNTFANVARSVSKNAFDTLLKVPNSYGILGDISDYLTPGQINVLEQGVQEQLKQGVNTNKLIYEASGGNINTGRGNVQGAIKKAISKFAGTTNESMIDYIKQKNALGPQQWLQKYIKQTDPPLIVPGVQNQFEGV